MLKRRVWKPIAGIIFLITLVSVALFFYSLLKLDILRTEYLIAVTAVLALLLFLVGFLLYHGLRRKRSTARRVRRILGVILAVVVTLICLLGSYLLSGLDRTREAVTNKGESEVRGYISVFVANDDAAQELADMGAYRFGVLAKHDELNTKYALNEIRSRIGTEVEAISYPGITDAAAAMRNGEINAIAVSEGFLDILTEVEKYADFPDEIRLVETIAVPSSASLESVGEVKIETVAGQDAESPVEVPAVTPEPTPKPAVRKTYGEDETLIFYLSGIDKWEGTESRQSHSDVNILMAVNPKTHQILFINTPRDYFITNPALGGGDKLTHCAVQGVYNSIAALEQLYNIEVDNYVKVNFSGFVRFINAIGGVDVYSPVTFTNEDNISFVEGMNHLDGGGALVFARERHSFGDGDISRGKNQIRVLEGVIEKMKTSGMTILLNYNEILDTMAGTFETDLTSSQISDLIKVASRDLGDWEIKSYSSGGRLGMRTIASAGTELMSIIFPTQKTVDFATTLFNMILNDEVITDEKLDTAPAP